MGRWINQDGSILEIPKKGNPVWITEIKIESDIVADLIVNAPETKVQRDELLTELKIIANADPSKWDADVKDQFQQWAQNRARAVIAKAEGKEQGSAAHPICPNCKSNAQVWSNQITGRLTCHRLGCHVEVQS